MILMKTEAGQLLLKGRHGVLSLRQRSAFILFDGKRSLQQVLEATATMGITEVDVQLMVDEGLLEPARPVQQVRSTRVVAPSAAAGMGAGGGRSPSERYQAGYLVATKLTAGLGLRGFRLNLAVEGATDFNSLAALAPAIRDAVGGAKYEALEQALFA